MQRQIERLVRNDIEAGVLRDGEALPSSEELAAKFGVSDYVVNKAMATLTNEGLIVAKARSGRRVNAPNQAAPAGRKTTGVHVLLMGGYAGSGKSELGRIIARQTGWPMLDKDTMTRPVVEAALEAIGLSPHDRESQHYHAMVRPSEYEALMAAITENVKCGNSAIATAPYIREFQDETWVERTRTALTALGATLALVWVYCDQATMLTYIRRRGAARDTGKLSNWDGYLGGLSLDMRPPGAHYVIENSASSRPLQAQARELIEATLSGTVK
jgi:predicted kinase/biotin operon repressor